MPGLKIGFSMPNPTNIASVEGHLEVVVFVFYLFGTPHQVPGATWEEVSCKSLPKELGPRRFGLAAAAIEPTAGPKRWRPKQS